MGIEELRPNNIASAVPDEHHHADSGLLGKPGHVGRDQRLAERLIGRKGHCQAKTGELSVLLVVGQRVHEHHANNRDGG